MKSLAFFAAGLFCVTFFISALRGEADASSVFRAGGSPDQTIVLPSQPVYLIGSDTSVAGLRFSFEQVITGEYIVQIPSDSMESAGFAIPPDSSNIVAYGFQVAAAQKSLVRIKIIAWNSTADKRYHASHKLELTVDGVLWPFDEGEYTVNAGNGQYEEVMEWELTREQTAQLARARPPKLQLGTSSFTFSEIQWALMHDFLLDSAIFLDEEQKHAR